MRVKDKAALVAGGGQGIGEGIVLCLAEEGADLVVVDIQEEQARRVADTVQAMGRKALAVPADLTREEEARKAVQKTVEYLGRIDILVNSAGINIRKPALDFDESDWDQVIDINLKGTFLTCQAVGRIMVRERRGKRER